MSVETVVVWIVSFGAIATALVAIFVLIKRLWAIFGWKGVFWAWAKKFIDTVDVITALPVTLAGLSARDDDKLRAIDKVRTELLAADAEKLRLITDVKDTLTEHMDETRVGREEWDAMKGTLHKLVATADAIQYEVKNNGGGSMKDQTDRIEAGVKGLYAKPGENGTPGREHESV